MKMEDFNEGVDGKLASRMRKVNQEQFFTLVRMHLSFELDLNTEDGECLGEKAKLKKWGLPNFSKKSKSSMNLQRGSENAALTLQGMGRVKQLMEYLSKEECIAQEGIFRRTGKLTRQQDLKAALYQGAPLELEDGPYSVHDCASVLKSFLAELPEPLLTELHYPAHCQIAELCTSDASAMESRLLSSLQLLLLLLPPVNRTLLRNLLNLLNKTATFESSNKMNCDTLATLFTPHLMCPRKLSPEALHVNSQHLSGLVAFMIKRGIELFEIPPKLATDIRAYWVEQERKLLSPKKNDLNESISDTTGTAHTVFSFVDHQLTAKANSTQDTQAALAQLYAHIQAMPESAKKRRLVKQFNKENGQGTPRHVKQYRTKSLGDSIKKHIFQKKLLGHKKLIDINIGSAISRSSSEENVLSTTRYEEGDLEKSSRPSKALFSKSDDDLSNESCNNSLETDNNLVRVKRLSSSTGSLNASISDSYKMKNSPGTTSRLNSCPKTNETTFANKKNDENDARTLRDHKNANNFIVNVKSDSKIFANSEKTVRKLIDVCATPKSSVDSRSRKAWKFINDEKIDDEKIDDYTTKKNRFSRHNSEPPDMFSSLNFPSREHDDKITRQNSVPIFPRAKSPNVEIVFTPKKLNNDHGDFTRFSGMKNRFEGTKNNGSRKYVRGSPMMKKKFFQVYAARTSTPSDLLRRNLTNGDYNMLTPIRTSDKSMSPITQSTTKMTRAMQETMMTPRSRKPVMMISGSNLCNLASLENSWASSEASGNRDFATSSLDVTGRKIRRSIVVEKSRKFHSTAKESTRDEKNGKYHRCNKENEEFIETRKNDEIIGDKTEINCEIITQRSGLSITSTFREYLLSRSVLTASPVDLSFTSRTGDFEQSESDVNILNEDELSESLLHCLNGNNPGSDTSGIASSNSAYNSSGRIDETISSGRKRCGSLRRDDTKKATRSRATMTEEEEQLREKSGTLRRKQMSESTLNSMKIKENVQETSF